MGIFKSIGSIFSGGSVVSHEAPAVRPSRNELCWCGSGLKYKKCHKPEDDKKPSPNYHANCCGTSA